MADVAETRDSPVGLPACGGARFAPPGPNTGGTGDSPVIPPNKSRASEPGVLSGELIFDAGELHAQLADLLQLYLKRAADPDAVAKCSAKDAISCAKTLTAMMSDVQSGKPASVDANTDWPRMESSSVGRGFIPAASSTHRRPAAINDRPTGSSRPTSYILPPTGSTPILEDALSTVFASDEEIQIPEPYKRLIARIQKLCIETQKRLDEAPNRVGGAHQRRSENEGCAKDAKSRASEPGLPNVDIAPESSCRVRSRAAPSSVGARHAVPSGEGDRAIRVFDPEAQTRRELPLRQDVQKPTTNNQQPLRQEPGVPNKDVASESCRVSRETRDAAPSSVGVYPPGRARHAVPSDAGGDARAWHAMPLQSNNQKPTFTRHSFSNGGHATRYSPAAPT